MNKIRQITILFIVLFISCLEGTAQTLDKSNNIPKDDFYKIVAQDGTGDYISIQDAINDSKAFPYQRITIFIKNGIYHEKVKVHEWNPYISLIGESKENTIITYNDYFDKINLGRNSTFYTATLLVEGDGFIAKNLTIENAAGDVGQAIALSINADEAIVINCNILGNQDTLYTSGNGFKNYFRDCFIQGTTDFIFGSATVFFENCTIHSLKDSYITAASTPEEIPYGFVFFNCKLSAEKNVTQMYLGRPWRIYAKTVFINCTMDNHIKPEGWHNWSKQDAEKNSFYAEYNCSGPGYLPKSRVSWSHQLNASQAKKYTVKDCMGPVFAKTINEWNFTSK
jgi:pectinesterase